MIRLDDLELLIEKQANNEGLWFATETASEAYLQDALRQLHGICEKIIKEAK